VFYLFLKGDDLMGYVNVSLNPLDVYGTGNALSNNNFTDSLTGVGNIRATHYKTQGKWYWEVKYVSGATNGLFIGIADRSFVITTNSQADAKTRSIYTANGNKYPENTSYGSSWAINDVIGIALDLDNGTLTFYKNGISLGISHTNIKSLTEVAPWFRNSGTHTIVFTVNFEATSFAYPIPDGYSAYGFYPSSKFLISSEEQTYSFETTDATKNIIPIMTSNTSPSGVASASSNYDVSAFQPWQSFSDKSTLYWVGKQGETTGWLRYDFSAPRVVNIYSMTASGFSNGAQPKDWTFEGSNNGVDWVVLDKRVNQTNWVFYTETRTFKFKNSRAFKSYRINVSSNNGNAVYLTIAQVKMMERSMKMYELPDSSEGVYLKHGMNKAFELELEEEISNLNFVDNQNSALGSGKVFKQKIDRSKHQANKIILG
jgi:hypothetical protein